MCELILETKSQKFRWRLLAETSALALMGYVATIPVAKAGDDERPTVWIEVGGQLDRVTGQAEPYEPPFAVLGEQHGLLPVGSLEAEPRLSLGEQGEISFQPNNSDWKVSASVQYGRANKHSYRHQQIPVGVVLANGRTQRVNGPNLAGDHGTALAGYVSQTSDYAVKTKVSHAIVDFNVGKDVGLGLWKGSVPGEVAFGVRYAQFSSHSKMNLNGAPFPHLANYASFYGYGKYLNQYYQFYRAKPEIVRNFSGWGPTISWNGSLPLVEADDDGAGITLDFAANAGVLFGRQKVQINHQTSGDIYAVRFLAPLSGQSKYSHDHYVNSTVKARSRSVVVPNIGGLAGLSFKLARAKVSVGYRADFFFGAMDGGVETRKTMDRNFYGPFATISIGLGD